MLVLSDDCVFVADAHFDLENRELLNDLKGIKASMIVLMGDIFDLLICGVDSFIKPNQELIDLLNHLSNTKKIIYLEGNHDFNIKYLFPKIQVIPIQSQPIVVKYQYINISISHGDHNVSFLYNNIYSLLIRNKVFISFLNRLNILLNNKLSNKIEKMQKEKNKCSKIKNFKQVISNRLIHHNEDYIIEGHYHQNKKYKINGKVYVNLPSYLCDKQILSIKEIIEL